MLLHKEGYSIEQITRTQNQDFNVFSGGIEMVAWAKIVIMAIAMSVSTYGCRKIRTTLLMHPWK